MCFSGYIMLVVPLLRSFAQTYPFYRVFLLLFIAFISFYSWICRKRVHFLSLINLFFFHIGAIVCRNKFYLRLSWEKFFLQTGEKIKRKILTNFLKPLFSIWREIRGQGEQLSGFQIFSISPFCPCNIDELYSCCFQWCKKRKEH